MQLYTLSFLTLSQFLSLNLSIHNRQMQIPLLPQDAFCINTATTHTCTSSNSSCAVKLYFDTSCWRLSFGFNLESRIPKGRGLSFEPAPIAISSFTNNTALKIFASLPDPAGPAPKGDTDGMHQQAVLHSGL